MTSDIIFYVDNILFGKNWVVYFVLFTKMSKYRQVKDFKDKIILFIKMITNSVHPNRSQYVPTNVQIACHKYYDVTNNKPTNIC